MANEVNSDFEFDLTSDMTDANDGKVKKTMKFYAVAKGREIGLFTQWDLCQLSTKGYSNSMYSSFKTLKPALKFLSDNGINPETVKIYTSTKESQSLSDFCIETNIVSPVDFVNQPDANTDRPTSKSIEAHTAALGSQDTTAERVPMPKNHPEEFLMEPSLNVDNICPFPKINENSDPQDDSPHPRTNSVDSNLHCEDAETTVKEYANKDVNMDILLMNSQDDQEDPIPEFPFLNTPNEASLNEASHQYACRKCRSSVKNHETIPCSKCESKFHYKCLELPLHIVYKFVDHTNAYSCPPCTLSDMPQEFLSTWQNDACEITPVQSSDKSSSTCDLIESSRTSDKESITNTVVSKDLDAFLVMEKISDALASICTQMNFKEEIHSIEEKLVDRLIESERANSELKIKLIETRLDHANELTASLKKSLKEKEAIIKTSFKSPENFELQKLEAEISQLRNKSNSKILELQLQCESLELQNKHLSDNLKLTTDNMSSKADSWKCKYQETASQLSISRDINKQLNETISTMSDEILALKLQNDSDDKGFLHPKKNAGPIKERKSPNILLQNRFKPLEINSQEIKQDNETILHKTTEGKIDVSEDIATNVTAKNLESTDTDVLIIGNSHADRIQPNKIYKHKKCMVKTAEPKNIHGAKMYIQQCPIKPKVIVYQVVSNDLESLSAQACLSGMADLVQITKSKYPDTKICVGAALPRELYTSTQTEEFLQKMAHFNNNLYDIGDIHVIYHNNIHLENCKLWSDKRHLSDTGMATLIRNFKSVLNPLLEMKPYKEYQQERAPIQQVPKLHYQHNREPKFHSYPVTEHNYYNDRHRYSTPRIPANNPSREFFNELDSLLKHYKHFS